METGALTEVPEVPETLEAPVGALLWAEAVLQAVRLPILR